MVGTTPGSAYPGLYAPVTRAIIVVSDDDWFVDTYHCVTFSVIGTPWTLPTTWMMVILPPCLVFNPATGMICGTPMQVGTTTVTMTALDATGRTITFTYTLTVRPKP